MESPPLGLVGFLFLLQLLFISTRKHKWKKLCDSVSSVMSLSQVTFHLPIHSLPMPTPYLHPINNHFPNKVNHQGGRLVYYITIENWTSIISVYNIWSTGTFCVYGCFWTKFRFRKEQG
jgi:hypothetical protein